VARLVWDAVGERFFETGVDRGVLYIDDEPGVPWNGLTSVSEVPSGGDAQSYYIDGIKYLNVPNPEEFEATIEAFTYPDEFVQCEGLVSPITGLFLTNQVRKSFGLTYRSLVGNDTEGPEKGYKIHLVYGALAEPSVRSNVTMDDSPTPQNFSWKITTLPPPVVGYRRTAHYIIDSRTTDPLALTAIEDALYGSESETSHLPTVAELFTIFETNSSFVVVDNGDGSFTASGTEFEVFMSGTDEFTINAPGAVIIDSDSYTLTSA
jgi:hypothetical protein